MVKKISALVLALLLCLSVVVMPVSAAVELGSAKFALSLEWDKEYYSAGDTAYLSVYADAEDGLALNQINVAIMVNSAVFDVSTPTGVPNAEIESFFKSGDSFLAKLSDTYLSRITLKNTTEENAAYDTGFKWAGGKNASGTHDNCQVSTDGFYFDDFDSNEPIYVFELKVKEGLADGTAVSAAITSGTTTCSPAQTQIKYYKTPGTSGTTGNLAAADIDLSQAVATATVGKAIPEFTINQGKDAIRFNKNADNSYKNISIRTTAEIAIADLQGACDGKTANDDVEKYITEAGFVYIPTTYEFSVDAAKAAITAITENEGVSNHYTKKKVSYIQKTDTSYKYICVVDVEDEAIASAAFNTFAYICLDFDGDGTADKTYYYEAVNSVSAKTLYNAKYGQANSTYGWTLAAK